MIVKNKIESDKKSLAIANDKEKKPLKKRISAFESTLKELSEKEKQGLRNIDECYKMSQSKFIRQKIVSDSYSFEAFE